MARHRDVPIHGLPLGRIAISHPTAISGGGNLCIQQGEFQMIGDTAMYENHIAEAIQMFGALDDFDTEEAFFAAVRDQALLMSSLDAPSN
jgi:hypothetical protein